MVERAARLDVNRPAPLLCQCAALSVLRTRVLRLRVPRMSFLRIRVLRKCLLSLSCSEESRVVRMSHLRFRSVVDPRRVACHIACLLRLTVSAPRLAGL